MGSGGKAKSCWGAGSDAACSVLAACCAAVKLNVLQLAVPGLDPNARFARRVAMHGDKAVNLARPMLKRRLSAGEGTLGHIADVGAAVHPACKAHRAVEQTGPAAASVLATRCADPWLHVQLAAQVLGLDAMAHLAQPTLRRRLPAGEAMGHIADAGAAVHLAYQVLRQAVEQTGPAAASVLAARCFAAWPHVQLAVLELGLGHMVDAGAAVHLAYQVLRQAVEQTGPAAASVLAARCSAAWPHVPLAVLELGLGHMVDAGAAEHLAYQVLRQAVEQTGPAAASVLAARCSAAWPHVPLAVLELGLGHMVDAGAAVHLAYQVLRQAVEQTGPAAASVLAARCSAAWPHVQLAVPVLGLEHIVDAGAAVHLAWQVLRQAVE